MEEYNNNILSMQEVLQKVEDYNDKGYGTEQSDIFYNDFIYEY